MLQWAHGSHIYTQHQKFDTVRDNSLQNIRALSALLTYLPGVGNVCDLLQAVQKDWEWGILKELISLAPANLTATNIVLHDLCIWSSRFPRSLSGIQTLVVQSLTECI